MPEPSRSWVIYSCPLCELWQVEMAYWWTVEETIAVNQVLKDHLLECPGVEKVELEATGDVVDLCPACGEPREVPGEGRFCGRCEDYEGHCANDHCMTCGAST